MRHDISAIDRLVEHAVNSGEFASKEECVSAMLNWLVLNDHVNPSRINGQRRGRDSGEPIDDRHAEGVSEAEEALLQYEILRDRDA